jgi:hypothetical protein
MDLVSQLVFALLLAIPVACVTWTVTQEELFREIRDALKAFQKRHPDSIWRQKLAYMPTCPFCFSHYVTAFFLFLFRFHLLTDDWRGYVVSLFTVVLLANVYISLYNLLRVTLRGAKAVADREEAEVQWIRKRASITTSASRSRWSKVRVPKLAEQHDSQTSALSTFPPDIRCQEPSQVNTPGRCKVKQE